MNILGLVENMSGLVCPHCGETVNVFGTGGGKKVADAMGLQLLAEIPIDPKMVESGDHGNLESLSEDADLKINKAYKDLVDRIEKK
jgi:hypothetical protein